MTYDEAKKKLIVALDLNSLEEAEGLVEKLKSRVSYFKIGISLFSREGPDVVKMVQDSGAQVFLDLKFHDIPNTVARAVQSVANLGVWMLNVHASGGLEMMRKAREAASQAKKPPLVIGVTVLTSLNSLEEFGLKESVSNQVLRLAKLCEQAGLDGVIASPQETSMLRKAFGSDFKIVTPGIRSSGEVLQDQKRVATPKEAMASGASYLVVGRPILTAKDALGATEKIVSELLSTF